MTRFLKTIFKLSHYRQLELHARLRLNPLCAMAAEGMDRSSARYRLTPMPGPLRNEILFSGFHWNALIPENERVAALNNQHILVVDVRVRS